LDEDVIAAIQAVVPDGKANYCVYQHEICPKTGQEHLQGFVMLKTKVRWAQLQVLFKTAQLHCEVMRGKPCQAADYCKKDESRKPGSLIFESGSCPSAAQGKRTDLDDVGEAIVDGASLKQIASDFPKTFMRYHRGIERYKTVLLEPAQRNRHTMCLVIFGAAGAGKSYWARTTFPNACWVTKGNSGTWFDDYHAQEVIIFDEFSGWIPLTWFKRLIDNGTLSLDAKGSSRVMAPTLCVFLCNDPPSEWYSAEILSGDNLIAFQRRLHSVIKVVEGVNFDGSKSGLFKCVMLKAFIPFDFAMAETWSFGKLTHEQSVELFNSKTAKERKLELICLGEGGSENLVPRFQCQSGGVILTPPLCPDFFENVSASLDFLVGYVFGRTDCPAGVVDTPPAAALASPPVPAPRQVSNPTAPVVPMHTQVYVPMPPAVGDKRPVVPLARSRKRRAAGCPYLDDEAEESDD